MYRIFIILSLIILSSCGTKDDATVEPPKFVKYEADWKMNCLRWIDRDLYFGTQDPYVSSRNNEFDKQYIKNLLKKIELKTMFGEDYFKIRTKPAGLLQPIRQPGLSREDIDSFILIWEDQKFEEFVNRNLGGFSAIPDKNAVSIVDASLKRKYYIIFRASCFDGKNAIGCDGIGVDGLNALIARQIGFVTQLPPANCETDPDNIMCPKAKDSQWTIETQEKFYEEITAKLMQIKNNINFYNDQEYSASCLNKYWMDKTIYVANPDGEKNNTFYIDNVMSTLEEISSSTLLGENYFNTTYENRKYVDESDIYIYFDRTAVSERPKSYLMVWPDVDLNQFIGENDLSIPDPNVFFQVNRAYKRNFTMIFRASCFEAFSPFCDGGNGGISSDGRKALIARQLGLAVGLDFKNCTDYPDDIMCAEIPSNEQWSIESKKRFFNRFNNALEYIGNNKYFYQEYKEYEDEDTE